MKRQREPQFAAMLDEQLGKQAAGKKNKKAKWVTFSCMRGNKLMSSDNRHRKSEKEEDEELLNENKEDEEEPYVFEESAPCMLRYRLMCFGLTCSR